MENFSSRLWITLRLPREIGLLYPWDSMPAVRTRSDPTSVFSRCGAVLNVRDKVVSVGQAGKSGRRGAKSRVVESSPDRPDYNRALKILKEEAQRAQE